MNQTSVDAIVGAVHEVIAPAKVRKIASASIAYGRAHTQCELWQILASSIDGSMKLDGFMHLAAAAPIPVLAPKVAGRVMRDSSLYATLLHLWAQSEENLRASIQGSLVDFGVTLGFRHIPDDLTKDEVIATVDGLVARVLEAGHDGHEDDIRVMVFCLLYVQGVSDADYEPQDIEPLGEVTSDESSVSASSASSAESSGFEESLEGVSDLGTGEASPGSRVAMSFPEEISATRFGAWARDLEALPASSEEWDQAEPFLRYVAAIRVAKAQDASLAGAIDAVRKRIRSVLGKESDLLTFLGLGESAGWASQPIPEAKLPELEVALQALATALNDYRQTRERLADASSRREEQDLRREVDRCADAVQSSAEELSSILGIASGGAGSARSADVGPSPEKPASSRKRKSPAKNTRASNTRTDPTATAVELRPEPAAPDDTASSIEGVASTSESEKDEIPPEAAERVHSERPAEDAEPVTAVREQPAAKANAEPSGEAAEEQAVDDGTQSCLPAATPQEAAEDFLSSASGTSASQLACSLVATDDIPAAYWITRALEENGEPVVMPSWLLAGAQGARWLSADSALVVGMRGLADEHQLDGKGLDGLFGLASSLKPVLIEPQSGLLGWLQACGEVANAYGLQDLVAAVLDFAELSFTGLRPEDLDPVRGAANREAALARASAEAGEWLKRARDLKPKYHKAATIWHGMVGSKGALHAMLAPVVANDATKVDVVRKDIELWTDESFIRSEVREIQLSLNKTKPPVIEAAAAEWFVRRIQETCACAEQWCQLVEREQKFAVRGDWLFQQVDTLRGAVSAALPTAEEVLVQSCKAEEDIRSVAATTCLLRALIDLRQVLDLEAPSDEVLAAVACDTTWPDRSWWTHSLGSLEQSLGRRLLWTTGVRLDDRTLPSESLSVVLSELAKSVVGGRGIEAASEERFATLQDFRFAETLLAPALPEDCDVAGFLERFHASLDGSWATLEAALQRTSQLVEQSVIDGATDEADRANYSAELEKLSVPSEDVADGPDIGSRLAELGEIERVMDERRDARVTEQSKEWKALHAKLQKRYNDSESRPLLAFVDERVKTGDLVVAAECIAALQSAYDSKAQALNLGEFMAPDRESIHETYKTSASDITSWAASRGLGRAIRDVTGRKESLPVDLTSLNKPRLEEVLRSLDSWQKLKATPGSRAQAMESIPAILRYLGFDLVFRDGRAAVDIKDCKSDWLHAVVGASAGFLARPIPQFGSMANGRYDVVCIWERPNVGTLGERLNVLGLSGHPVIVLYLGHLYDDQRRDLVTASRSRGLSAAVLDESLLLFLAMSIDDRLPDFLACALPYASLNPYTPSVAGNVPQEIYYGRDDLAEQLQSQQGTCLVYGGRQLGKSALLRHVERQFHKPESERFCAVEDIKHIGDAESHRPAAHIWRRLHRILVDFGLISGRFASRGDLARKTVAFLEKAPDRRVIVMFDEADNFLDDDSRNGFEEVNALKVLMERTSRRFKVVFAGLHQVQRFQSLPNQPLAHLGRPIVVGPLEPIPAMKLVRAPMEMLGYDLDNAAVLRILSYTNYHPGLIQLFCHELVKHLNAKPRTKLPPYPVDQATIESVYYKDVRDGIRDRFDWTLALDPYYQVIAWSIILDQLESHDGFARTYSLADVMRTVGDWWAAGFESVPRDELRGLLTEMCGLGVLVVSRSDQTVSYRLRSPNLVRLMGTEEDVMARLDELDKKLPREADLDRRSLRRWVEEAGRYSPLTISQEQQVNLPRFGVSLVFGSEALGMSGLEDAARTVMSADASSREFQAEVMPKTVSDGETAHKWLHRFLDRNGTSVGLVACLELGDLRARVVQSIVEGCIRYCEGHRLAKKGPWLRVVLALQPSSTWEWLNLPKATRTELESRADVATSLRPLDGNGVRQLLRGSDMMATETVCDSVLGATAGWPLLIDELRRRAGGSPDPRSAVDGLRADLETKSELRSRIRSAAGIDVAHVLVPILHEVQSLLPAGEEELLAVAPAVVDVESQQVTAAIEYSRRMGYLVDEPISAELVMPALVSSILDP